MGREGVAYTFVTTEEGGELTRIEILINRLLKRDEIEGFATVATALPAAVPSADASDSASDEPQADKSPRPLPPGRRAPKRHRRAHKTTTISPLSHEPAQLSHCLCRPHRALD